MLTIILIVVAVVALSMISWVVARKAPQLSAMNVEETPQAKARLLKQAIVAAKFLRRLRELQSKFAAPESWRLPWCLAPSDVVVACGLDAWVGTADG